jgi:hypothetical protein
MPYNKKPSTVLKMYDKKGKQAGLMMEGSVNHMESVMQEKKNLTRDMPIDNRGVGEMSPYKMNHGSAAHHAGKSKLHAKPGKDYPDDGHLHYQGNKKVESPGVSETKKLSDTSGAVVQMSPYKFTGMSRGSAMHAHGPGGSHPTTTLSNALASNEDYEVVPGFEERLGGELDEVVLTGEKKKPKKKSFKEKHGYTRVGGFIDDIKYGRIIKRPLNWGTLSSRRKERRVRNQKWWGNN